MENAISALLVIGVMLLAVVGITNSALSAQAALTDATIQAQARISERMHTLLTPSDVGTDDTGEIVQLTLKNSGTTRLADFSHWDVIVEYQDGVSEQVNWLPYGTDANEWSAQIYQDAATLLPESFDPNILNPGEDLVVTVNVSPAMADGSTNRITVVTPNGVAVAETFTH